MGYTTLFAGRFEFKNPVTDKFMNYINEFSNTRHVKRDNATIEEIHPDWKGRCFNGVLGINGEYFLHDEFVALPKYDSDPSILDINNPPECVPGLWCQWVISDNKYLEWNGAEKFYCYIDWLHYLIENFIKPSMYELNGKVDWQGEEASDYGQIKIEKNKIYVTKEKPWSYS